MRLSSLPLLCTALVLGCGGSPRPPSGVKCSTVRSAGRTAGELTDELGLAKAGECVVPRATAYQGAFVVKAGVKLVAQDGAALTLSNDQKSVAALTVNGGQGSGAFGVTVDGAAGEGIDVVGGPAQLVNVKVRRASASAVRVTCSGADCLLDASLVELTNADLRESENGLAVFGARVTVTGGASVGNTSPRLGYGYGVVAASGAVLEINGMQVEGNLTAGVVVDGSGGTSVQLADVKVVNNLGRGIWAQGLLGSTAAPKLVISGKQTVVESNRIVGLGVISSTGIQVTDARIAGTVKVKLGSAVGVFEDVGDGVGLFTGTGLARFENVALENNQRSQMLVDKSGGGISIIIPDLGKVAGGDFKLVVQNTTEPVTAPPEVVSMPGRELLVKAESLVIPRP